MTLSVAMMYLVVNEALLFNIFTRALYKIMQRDISSFLIFINPTRVIQPPYLGKTTAVAKAVLPIDTSMCSISVCPKNGIAACCLGFVGDTPILIDAIKLLCTISDNP